MAAVLSKPYTSTEHLLSVPRYQRYRHGIFDYKQEIMKSVVPLSKTKHGRFLVISLLRYSSKDEVEQFIKAITGKVQSMCIHQVASVHLSSLLDP